MKLSSSLSRWIVDLINARYRQASKREWMDSRSSSGYRLTLRKVIEESGIIPQKECKDNIKRVRRSLDELKKHGFLDPFEPYKEYPFYANNRGRGRPNVINMEWTLFLGPNFVEEIIKGNICHE